ncbi:50S ribosomal protein L22 [Ligilactobacillus hayakitensis DSM 18933 = JCM 14209]|uniref:Large ribosomal subunit protein uL22 n=1 Tax=Ligilactobacillus hayakitensis DSM 18933 = JCM 14209 TaxID=1423755 RepID=A0A0R1WPG6_9LACO|nr:50S ribosomal protein L22 [Ligilactobacillus hayakitensis]KRM19776.1 50S ribosomal protein L22 [Ligilactobacillus hayakitensis DSM 18933 = JCM 14209]
MAEQVTSAKATAKTVRIPARKARLVIDLIRGKSVAEAFGILNFTPRSGAYLIEKVLKSAVANAENNFDLDVEDLYVSEAFVNEGPTLKRFRPRAKGSASPINKRTSHITVVVSVK